MKTYNELCKEIELSTEKELDGLISLCIGRVLNMGSRPTQPEDVKTFDECALLVRMASEELKFRRIN